MQHLILARHGHDNADRISSLGQQQMEALAERLETTLEGKSVLILSSTTSRAQESSIILSQRFNAPIEAFDVLWSESSHPENMDGALQLIDEHADKADVLLVVTHYEYVKDFPAHYGRNRLGVTFPSKLIDKGRAWVIDIEKKQIQCF